MIDDSSESYPDLTYILAPPDPAYWRALGEFTEEFARTEAVLYLYFKTVIKIDGALAQAVFSGLRTEQMMQYVRRTWSIAAPADELRVELNLVFGQLKEILNIRNSVLHYASQNTPHGRISSNAMRALTPETAVEHRISAELLGDMTADVRKIAAHLFSLIMSPSRPFEERAELYAFLGDAWRYKHEPDQRPKSPRPSRKHRKQTPEHHSPPESSEESP